MQATLWAVDCWAELAGSTFRNCQQCWRKAGIAPDTWVSGEGDAQQAEVADPASDDGPRRGSPRAAARLLRSHKR